MAKILVVWVWMSSYAQWVPTQVVEVTTCDHAVAIRREYYRVNNNPRLTRVKVTCE